MALCITQLRSCILLILLTVFSACGSSPAGPPRGMLSMPSLARHLKLEIDRQTSVSVRFTGEAGRVLVVGPPSQAVVVNGIKLPGAQVVTHRGQLFLDQKLLSVLQRQLKDDHGHLANHTVMLDAGHGGRDPGAPNAWGPSEKVVVMDITNKVRRLLEARGVEVLMTRDGDTYPSLDDRVAQANKANPELFVSIHADSAPAPEAHGFSVYVARQASRSSRLAADTMLASLISTGTRNRGIKKADFRVIAKTTCPAILIETGFLSCAKEARQLSKSSYRTKMAKAIAQGILRHLAAVEG